MRRTEVAPQHDGFVRTWEQVADELARRIGVCLTPTRVRQIGRRAERKIETVLSETWMSPRVLRGGNKAPDQPCEDGGGVLHHP